MVASGGASSASDEVMLHTGSRSLKMTLPLSWRQKPCRRLCGAYSKRTQVEARGLKRLEDDVEVPLDTLIGDALVKSRNFVVVTTEEERLRVGIVCQVRDASTRIESFVKYHLKVGFAMIYLYFDDCGEIDDAEKARRAGGDKVQIRFRDANLVEEWSTLVGWDKLKAFAHGDVQVRQMLNALHALKRARSDRLDWLLHIDSDELFYPGEEAKTIHDHFSDLDKTNCGVFTYYNYEAVPEEDTEEDPFRTVTLFKRSLAVVPPDIDEGILDFWRSRSPNNEVFLFYQNGKSAVRCSRSAVPASVHVWLTNDGPANGRSNDHRNKGLTFDKSVTCAVLHFACTDSTALWRKYSLLGNFSNACVADTIHHQPDTFHCLCRDTLTSAHRHHHHLSGGDHGEDLSDRGQAALADLFRSSVLLDDPVRIRNHLDADLLVRISLVPF